MKRSKSWTCPMVSMRILKDEIIQLSSPKAVETGISLSYVCNEVREGARTVNLTRQKEIVFEKDLFSG